MKKILVSSFIVLCTLTPVLNPAHAGWRPYQDDTEIDNKIMNKEVSETITLFKNSSPIMEDYFKNAYGYAVFPNVGKGGLGIGGAYGKGEVYEKEDLIGYSSLKQVSLGLQFGGQKFSEIIFFKDKQTLDDFKKGNFKLGARASAVAITAGVATDADYSDGVAIFTYVKSGLMFDASVCGQKFSFTPK